MILGLSLSHDASAGLTDMNGRVVAAIGEERLSRRKNHIGLPIQAIESLLTHAGESQPLQNIVIGSHQNLSRPYALRMVADLTEGPSTVRGKWMPTPPGWSNQAFDGLAGPAIIEKTVRDYLRDHFPESIEVPFTWIKHHDSHLGCALGLQPAGRRLLLSLDGAGDGESGAFAVSEPERVRVMARIPAADSLGMLYSAVTARYNFAADRHEGKITGLAAFGQASAAVDVLRQHVSVRSGIPHIRYPRNLLKQILNGGLKRIGMAPNAVRSLSDIADLAASKTTNYPDLAWAVQTILEESVLEIVSYWVHETQIPDLALAGGVFSNVRLNQRIAELPVVRSVEVFPSMGDGGIALGGIWSDLKRQGSLAHGELFNDMFLGPQLDRDASSEVAYLSALLNLKWKPLHGKDLHRYVAGLIAGGKVVGWHTGRVEFGPRALGHRSILLDPRRKDIVSEVNQRLRRTEFMPFAPVVLSEHASKYFDLPSPLDQPYQYMTMTCSVKKEYRDLLPAVTHVDHTARPQVVPPACSDYRDIIQAFGELTGLFVVVNTSLNVHEEPITGRLRDSARALASGALDYLVTEVGVLSK